MNKITITLALLVSTTIIFAQAPEGLKIGVGVRASLPLGDFGTLYSAGIGGELQAEYGINESFSAILSTGYNSFFGKNIDLGGFGSIKAPALGYIPVLGGLRYYATNNLYIGGQAGYGILTGEGDSEGAFNYQPQIGINLEKLQFTLNYNVLTKNNENLSNLGLTAVYKIGSN